MPLIHAWLENGFTARMQQYEERLPDAMRKLRSTHAGLGASFPESCHKARILCGLTGAWGRKRHKAAKILATNHDQDGSHPHTVLLSYFYSIQYSCHIFLLDKMRLDLVLWVVGLLEW